MLKKKEIKISKIRNEFPILKKKINGYPLIYFDNASSNQKPKSVINSIKKYYENFNSNVHRSIHTLSEISTNALELTRKSTQKLINANEPEEIIFTKNTTEGINLIASTYGREYVNNGDEIIISYMEHHSNIVPWQILCKEKKAILKIIPIDKNGDIDIKYFNKILTKKTKIVSIMHASNTIGSINPIEEIISKSHKKNAKVLIDGAQSISHLKIDVKKNNCDFFVFSANKVYGPTGVGVLYGKREILEKMPPYQFGGEMIKKVEILKSTYNEIPYKFESGTPNIANIIAFKESINFIKKIGINNIFNYENKLLEYVTEKLKSIEKIKIIGSPNKKVSLVSFIVKNMHNLDVSILLDAKGIAIRNGHHCTQPLMNKLKIEGTIRVSLSIYNTKEEIDYFIENLKKIVK
ncbi:MAG: SufS family cysteine desulfurase [Cytophagales bacterium]